MRSVKSAKPRDDPLRSILELGTLSTPIIIAKLSGGKGMLSWRIWVVVLSWLDLSDLWYTNTEGLLEQLVLARKSVMTWRNQSGVLKKDETLVWPMKTAFRLPTWSRIQKWKLHRLDWLTRSYGTLWTISRWSEVEKYLITTKICMGMQLAHKLCCAT